MEINIGERLRLERKRLKLNQSSFGESVGVLQKTQSSYEKDKRKPDSEYLCRASEIGVDITYVITGKRNDALLSESERMMLQLWREASPAIQSASLAVLGSGSVPVEDERFKKATIGQHISDVDLQKNQGEVNFSVDMGNLGGSKK